MVKTNSCQAPHTQYIVSGRLKVIMDDGSEEEFGPGDTGVIPPGHNAWVIGNEPCVTIDSTGAKEYAKSSG
jgi:quercetin dioxygenase-like cupin family protein